jgi:hypothetical protein
MHTQPRGGRVMGSFWFLQGKGSGNAKTNPVKNSKKSRKDFVVKNLAIRD